MLNKCSDVEEEAMLCVCFRIMEFIFVTQSCNKKVKTEVFGCSEKQLNRCHLQSGRVTNIR